mgnify:CR=1 FL=1
MGKLLITQLKIEDILTAEDEYRAQIFLAVQEKICTPIWLTHGQNKIVD